MTSCMVCGLRLYRFRANEDTSQWRQELATRTKWWGDVRLLCDPDDEVGTLSPPLSYPNVLEKCTVTLRQAQTKGFRPRSEASPIEVHTGKYWDRGRYAIRGSDGAQHGIVILDVKRFEIPRTFDNRHYIPVHSVCLQMAEKLWETAPDNAFIKDLRGLCIALTWRFALALKCHGPRKEFPPNYVLGRSHFYHHWEHWRTRMVTDPEFQPAHALSGPAQDLKENIPDLWGTNPLEIENLTDSILVSLCETPRHKLTNFENRLFSLPQELLHMILDAIDFRDLARVTTGFLPQKLWLDQLKSGCLPWLWDLDHALIDAKASEPCPRGEGYEWNWELLVRQLSRGIGYGVRADVPKGTDPFEPIKKNGKVIRSDDTFWEITGYHNDLQYVPPGLLNRRRIWQLLEELFVGDFIPQTQKSFEGPIWVVKDYIELPWSKSGEVLNSPKMIPSFDIEPYARRLNGEVYTMRGYIRPMQYWQDPGGYWKEHFKHLGPDFDGDPDNKKMRPPDGTPPEDINKILRGLGYPV